MQHKQCNVKDAMCNIQSVRCNVYHAMEKTLTKFLEKFHLHAKKIINHGVFKILLNFFLYEVSIYPLREGFRKKLQTWAFGST